MLTDLLTRVRALFRRNSVESELDAELRFHFDHQVEKFLSDGLSLDEARRRARLTIGASDSIKEECREARGTHFFESFLQDVRYAFRTLRKNLGFTTVAVITLTLGIAVNATMFSLVSAFMLRRPPGRDSDRIAVITSVNPAPGYQSDANPVSAPNYFAWRDANHVFTSMAADDEFRTASLTSQGNPESLHSAAVSPNYFDVLGVTPQLGRTFDAAEDHPGQDHVVILSFQLWQRHFGADASVIGRTVRINRENYSVIGVMPENFRLMGFTPQLWTPLVLNSGDQTAGARGYRFLYLFARLKPDVTLDQARAELLTLARRNGENFPDTEKGWGAAVRTLPDFLLYTFGIASGIAVIMTTVGFVLLIACANVAGLMLARSAARKKELAIRIALGAGRLRIICQLLTEGLVIAVLGGAFGLLLTCWGINFIRANLNFNDAISAIEFKLDWNVLLFTLTISIICALLCGLAPSLKASRTDSNSNLKEEGRGSSPSRSFSRLRTIMVTAELALALVLLIGTGLLLRGISLIDHQYLGFRSDHLLTADVTLDSARYKDSSERILFVQNLLARLQQIPGAQSAAVTSDLPATGPGSVTLDIKGQPELPANQKLSALDVVITPGYFSAADIPLLRGRTFTEMDNFSAPRVVVVNQEFVRLDLHGDLHGEDPVGKQIRLDVIGGAPSWSEIVGVVANVKTYSEETRDDPQVYEPFLQRTVPSFSLMLRTSSDPNNSASALRESVAQVDSELPVARLMSMTALIERQKAGNPFFLRVLSCFAVLALILSAIGIYGLIAYSVGQRTHELGIRMALGATSRTVLRMILLQGVKMSVIGAAIGLVLSLPLPKVFESLFYGLHFGESRTYFIVPLAIIAVATLATYIPARRATRIDPIIALRHE